MGKAEQSDTHHRTGMSLWVALGGLDRQEAGAVGGWCRFCTSTVESYLSEAVYIYEASRSSLLGSGEVRPRGRLFR